MINQPDKQNNREKEHMVISIHVATTIDKIQQSFFLSRSHKAKWR